MLKRAVHEHATVFLQLFCHKLSRAQSRTIEKAVMKLSDHSGTALSGRAVDFKSFAGKPVLMCNVASC